MALRSEDLTGIHQAVVYAFPDAAIRARAVRLRRIEIRRRRLMAALTGLALVAMFLLATGPTGAAPASVERAPRAITVGSGDTLWGLAERYAPENMDPRAYIDVLSEINGLEGGLVAGTRIRLPK